MNGSKRNHLANLSARFVAGCHGLVRRILMASLRYARNRKAVRVADRDVEFSGHKLTDEMERKMMARLTRNRSFKL